MRSFCGRRYSEHLTLLLLLKIFFEIIALRKGPEHLPRSLLVLAAALLLMLVSAFAMMSVTEQSGGFAYSFFAYALGLGFYGFVILLAGKQQRIVQALAAIIGCGSLITLFYVVETQLFAPIIGKEASAIIGELVVFWSVPVEGHVIARAINQHWFVGIGIAMLAFIMQVAIYSTLTGNA